MILKIFTDGGARGNPGPAAIGVHVENETGETVYEGSHYLGVATNNSAEYKALHISLEWLATFDLKQVEKVEWYLDSQLVVEQIKKNWKIKEPHLLQLAQEIWLGLSKLSLPYSFQHVPRALNKKADTLVNLALDSHLASR